MAKRSENAGLDVAEVFSSIQGEGLLAGQKHLFLRLAGCNLRCRYCDTAWARKTLSRPRFPAFLAKRRNPVSFKGLSDLLRRVDQSDGPHRFLSVTGGEPLVQARPLSAFLSSRPAGLPVLLETNASLPEAIYTVLPHLSLVSADIKLAERSLRVAQKTCFQMAIDAGIPFHIKIVIEPDTPRKEVLQQGRMLASLKTPVPVILQPATSRKSGKPLKASLLHAVDLQHDLVHILGDVRVLPQMHRILGIR